MNRRDTGYSLAVNHFTDMTDDEFSNHRGHLYDSDDDYDEPSYSRGHIHRRHHRRNHYKNTEDNNYDYTGDDRSLRDNHDSKHHRYHDRPYEHNENENEEGYQGNHEEEYDDRHRHHNSDDSSYNEHNSFNEDDDNHHRFHFKPHFGHNQGSFGNPLHSDFDRIHDRDPESYGYDHTEDNSNLSPSENWALFGNHGFPNMDGPSHSDFHNRHNFPFMDGHDGHQNFHHMPEFHPDLSQPFHNFRNMESPFNKMQEMVPDYGLHPHSFNPENSDNEHSRHSDFDEEPYHEHPKHFFGHDMNDDSPSPFQRHYTRPDNGPDSVHFDQFTAPQFVGSFLDKHPGPYFEGEHEQFDKSHSPHSRDIDHHSSEAFPFFPEHDEFSDFNRMHHPASQYPQDPRNLINIEYDPMKPFHSLPDHKDNRENSHDQSDEESFDDKDDHEKPQNLFENDMEDTSKLLHNIDNRDEKEGLSIHEGGKMSKSDEEKFHEGENDKNGEKEEKEESRDREDDDKEGGHFEKDVDDNDSKYDTNKESKVITTHDHKDNFNEKEQVTRRHYRTNSNAGFHDRYPAYDNGKRHHVTTADYSRDKYPRRIHTNTLDSNHNEEFRPVINLNSNNGNIEQKLLQLDRNVIPELDRVEHSNIKNVRYFLNPLKDLSNIDDTFNNIGSYFKRNKLRPDIVNVYYWDSSFPNSFGKDYFKRHKKATKHNQKIPENLDWREYGAVNPVRAQGMCGSCWAFSTSAAVESAHFVKTGQLVKLSEQQLLDCTWFTPGSKIGNNGCLGGWTWKSFAYIKKFGLATEQSYGSYIGMEGRCNTKNLTIGATIDSYMKIKPFSAKALMKAIAKYGPATASINTHPKSLKFYSSGIYDDKACKSTFSDHSVLVVGYGKENGKLYWIVRNSWSKNWGEKGYIKILNGRCGILRKPWVVINRKRKPLPWLEKTDLGEAKTKN